MGGPGEGPAFVAEEFALEKAFRRAGGVYGDEGPAAAAHLMNLPGHDLLAHTRLAQNEHGRVGDADVTHLFEQGAEPAAEDGRDVAIFLKGDGLEAFLLMAGLLVAHALEAQGRAHFRGEEAGQQAQFPFVQMREGPIREGAVQIEQPRVGLSDVEGQAQAVSAPASAAGGRVEDPALQPRHAGAHGLAFQFHARQVDRGHAGQLPLSVRAEEGRTLGFHFHLGDGREAEEGVLLPGFRGQGVEGPVAPLHEAGPGIGWRADPGCRR